MFVTTAGHKEIKLVSFPRSLHFIFISGDKNITVRFALSAVGLGSYAREQGHYRKTTLLLRNLNVH